MAERNWMAECIDTFFNGRPATKTEPTGVTMQYLVTKGTAYVRYRGKVYKIVVTEHEDK